MKIGPLDIKPAPAASPAERKPGTSSPVPAAEPSARVELSPLAAGTDAHRADFDSRKVERIALAIRDGSFKIDAEAIADKLIANAQELLPRAPR
jgi:negative regulator of flagellin synthesis FlgM